MISYGTWTGIPYQTRLLLAPHFGLAQTRPTHVSDNTVVDDGFSPDAVQQAFTLESVQSFLGTKETDQAVLVTMLIDKVTPKEPVVEPDVPAAPQEEAKEDDKPKAAKKDVK